MTGRLIQRLQPTRAAAFLSGLFYHCVAARAAEPRAVSPTQAHVKINQSDNSIRTLFAQAERNLNTTLKLVPEVASLAGDIFGLYAQSVPLIYREEELVLLGLLGRSASAYFGAIRLALSAQTYEAYSLIRNVIENAQYAAHIKTDPIPYERATSYLKRGDSPEADRKCRNEFGHGRPSASASALDKHVGDIAQQLYDRAIDLGAHPNQLALFAGMRRIEHDNGAEVHIVVMTDDST